MREFMTELTGEPARGLEGATADTFTFADGSTFAIADAGGMGPDARSIGFLVSDAAQAHQELVARGVSVDELGSNERFRYFHFVAPDGNTYEMVEDLHR